MSAAVWPYLVIVGAGFLPNEIFRVFGVLLGRGLNDQSELFIWIRIVALALLAAVVAKLLYAPPAALASVPGIMRLAALTLGVAAFYVARRRLVVGILAGEALVVAAAWWFGPA